MTRLAVEPPTMLLCCIFFLHSNGAWDKAIAAANVVKAVAWDQRVGVIQDDALDFSAGKFNFHLTVL